MSRAKALTDLVATLPVGAFDGPEAEDPHLLGVALFGAHTRVEWVVIADGVGSWQSTWVAVVPTSEGLVGIATKAPEADQENWVECSPGQRVDMLLAAARGPVVGPCPDLVSSAAACVDRIPAHTCASRCLPGQPHALFEPFQDPGFPSATWLLRAVLADQSAAQVDAVFTLLALTCEPDRVATARTELEALAHLCTNGATSRPPNASCGLWPREPGSR